MSVLLLLLPSAALAHGNHASIVHLVTLHVLPWISDRPFLVSLLVFAYFVFLWYAYRKLVAREDAEESVSAFYSLVMLDRTCLAQLDRSQY